MNYLFRDHLGSLIGISDAFGDMEAERRFSEWGEAVQPGWNNASTATVETAFLAITDEFYTGQETLAFGLVHYNGRVYDTQAGQFLSADPYITA